MLGELGGAFGIPGSGVSGFDLELVGYFGDWREERSAERGETGETEPIETGEIGRVEGRVVGEYGGEMGERVEVFLGGDDIFSLSLGALAQSFVSTFSFPRSPSQHSISFRLCFAALSTVWEFI